MQIDHHSFVGRSVLGENSGRCCYLESAEFSVVINLLLTRVLGGTRQHQSFYQFPCRFFRAFLEFRYHREIRGHPKRPVKYEDFALRIQQRNRHSRAAIFKLQLVLVLDRDLNALFEPVRQRHLAISLGNIPISRRNLSTYGKRAVNAQVLSLQRVCSALAGRLEGVSFSTYAMAQGAHRVLTCRQPTHRRPVLVRTVLTTLAKFGMNKPKRNCESGRSKQAFRGNYCVLESGAIYETSPPVNLKRYL